MKISRILLILLVIIISSASALYAQYLVIDANQVKEYLTGSKKVVLIDTRTAEEYAQAHIPGAIFIAADRIEIESSKLPRDKTTPLIFYCRGLGCSLSRSAATGAAKLGYTYLMIYQAGMPDWLLSGFPVQKGKQRGSLK